MSDEHATTEAVNSKELAQALRKLTAGYGIRSATLHADLSPALRLAFGVPDWDSDNLRTRARVSWHLEQLISTQLVGENLRQVARVSFNLGVVETRELKLVERRNWLYSFIQGPSPSESQRDLRATIVPAFAASLQQGPPGHPSHDEVAALMAVETGRRAEEYLPFPTEQAVAPGPPIVAGARDPVSIRIRSRVIIIIALAVVAVIVGFNIASSGSGNLGGTTTTAAGATPTTRTLPVSTVTEVGGNHHGSPTFKDPFHPAESGLPVSFRQEVQVVCKLRVYSLDSIGPDGYWYRIASSPWDGQYYAPAITFLNGDPVNGPYSHNYDPAVPDC